MKQNLCHTIMLPAFQAHRGQAEQNMNSNLTSLQAQKGQVEQKIIGDACSRQQELPRRQRN